MTALHTKHAQELRDTWQGRTLAETKGKLFIVVMAIISHEWPTALPTLLRTVFPDFRDIARPFINSYATITRSGRVVASVMTDDGPRLQIIFESEAEMVKEFRDLADRLKLPDGERIEMTAVLKKWVVADHRINVMGERKAS